MKNALIAIAAIIIAGVVLLPALNKSGGNNGEEAQAAPSAAPPKPAPMTNDPQLVSIEPANGATNVSPATTQIKITFDRPMGAGFSCTGGGPQFPTSAPGQKAHWLPDKKTFIVPVQLQPNWQYRMGINSPSYRNFKSASGVPFQPMLYTFTTGAN